MVAYHSGKWNHWVAIAKPHELAHSLPVELASVCCPKESLAKPGIDIVYSTPCNKVPLTKSSTQQVLIVAHLGVGTGWLSSLKCRLTNGGTLNYRFFKGTDLILIRKWDTTTSKKTIIST